MCRNVYAYTYTHENDKLYLNLEETKIASAFFPQLGQMHYILKDIGGNLFKEATGKIFAPITVQFLYTGQISTVYCMYRVHVYFSARVCDIIISAERHETVHITGVEPRLARRKKVSNH